MANSALIRIWLYVGILLLFLPTMGGLAEATTTIDFTGLTGADGSPFTTYTEYGFTVSSTSNNWLVGQNYGHPAPFIYFVAPPSSTVIGSIEVTDGGSMFSFSSIDLYSSITTIPYVFTGFLGNTTAFAVTGTVGNTYGNFATVLNPFATTVIDKLEISLTNLTPPCCSNPMGLDNIVLGSGSSVPEPTSLSLVLTGLSILSSKAVGWRRIKSPEADKSGS